MTTPEETEELLTSAVAAALAPIIRRMVQPELYYADTFEKGIPSGALIGERMLAKPGYQKKYGKPPLAPRDRCAARLTILLALTKARHALVKEILADTESIADAKAHGYELNLGGQDAQPEEADPGRHRREPGAEEAPRDRPSDEGAGEGHER